MITVAARVFAKAETADQVEKILTAVLEPVRKEEGCILYELHKDADGKPEFLFYEHWESPEALAAHNKTPHITALGQSLEGLLEKESELTVWDIIK